MTIWVEKLFKNLERPGRYKYKYKWSDYAHSKSFCNYTVIFYIYIPITLKVSIEEVDVLCGFCGVEK